MRLAKTQRQHRVAKLLENHRVTSQAHLVELLASDGVEATQATVSRDLDEIGAIKVRVAGGETVYAVPELPKDRMVPEEQLRRVLGHMERGVAQGAQPDRLGMAQEHAADALERRKAPDGLMGLAVDAARDEISQLAVLVYDAQGAVPRVYQLAGRLDDPLQDRGQAQVRGDAEHRVKQLLEAYVKPLHVCHRWPFWSRSHHLGRVSATNGPQKSRAGRVAGARAFLRL